MTFIFILSADICDACQASYIGSTVKQTKVMFFQHMDVSHRTSLPIAKPVQSSIRDHSETNDHRMCVSNLSVVASSENWHPRTVESIQIQNNKPLLNIDRVQFPYMFCKFELVSVHFSCMYIYLPIFFFLLLLFSKSS